MTQNNKVQITLKVSVTTFNIKRLKSPGKGKYFQMDFKNKKTLNLHESSCRHIIRWGEFKEN